MVRRLLLSALMCTSLAWPAAAVTPLTPPKPEPAAAGTSEGAKALRQILADYLTPVPFERNILRIEPDPAGQRVILDPAAALSELAGAPIRFAPISVILSKRDDGNWNVFTQDAIDVTAEPDAGGQKQTFEYKQDSQFFKGVFSPALAAFTQGEGTAFGTVNTQSDPVSLSRAEIRTTSVSTSAKPGATSGGADIDIRQTYTDYRQTTSVSMPAGEGTDAAAGMSFGFELGAAEVDSTAKLSDGRTRAITDLYALAIRHAGDLERDAKGTLAGPFGAELKGALRAALPLWNALEGQASARDLKLTSPYGELAMGEVEQAMRATGIDTAAGFDIDTSIRGIEAASPLIPSWAASLLPREMEIGFAMSGVDLATPAAMALSEVDFAAEEPLSPKARERLAATFASSDIRTRLKPSRIVAEDFDVAFSGEFTFDDAQPAAEIAVEAGGLDKAIATLQQAAATQPELNQAVGMLQIVKGFGRPKGERMEWIVAAAADGSVTINGTMVKGPTPAEETVPDDLVPDVPDSDGTAPSEGTGTDL